MKTFSTTFRNNLNSKSAATWSIIALLIGMIILMWILVSVIIQISFLGLIISIMAVLYGATKIPQLGWFWGKEEPIADHSTHAAASEHHMLVHEDGTERQSVKQLSINNEYKANQESTLETDEEPLLEGCEKPRETPQGTRLLSQSENRAVMQIKSLIPFWNWFLPGAFTVSAFFIGIPLGGFLGYQSYVSSSSRYMVSSAPYTVWGSILTVSAFLVVAIICYFKTRPWVEVDVSKEAILYGGRKFDRRYHYGMQIGYKSGEGQLKTSALAPAMGVQNVRLTYGPWGEDLKYMVNAYHASEIIVWMNDIIDGIGASSQSRYDPYAGRKIELL